MSHFTVLVIGDDIEGQLAPFQENNMGDCPKEYLAFNDVEPEYRERWETDSTTMFENKEGRRVSTYGDDAYRLLTAEEKAKLEASEQYREAKLFWKLDAISEVLGIDKHEIRGGHSGVEDIKVFDHDNWTRVKVPLKEAYPDFYKDYLEGYGDYEKDPETGKYGYWENPNAKWDWWQIGGRWSGMLRLKPRVLAAMYRVFNERMREVVGADGEFSEAIAKFRETLINEPGIGENALDMKPIDDDYKLVGQIHIGSPGLMTESAALGFVDSAPKGFIDVDYMRDEAAKKAAEKYDKFHEVVAGREIPVWSEIHEKHGDNIDAARDEYHNHPVKKDIVAALDSPFIQIEDFVCDRDAFIQRARDQAFTTFAVIKDGQWYERGSMGWWGIVSDEKENDEWFAEFRKLIDDLPDDTRLTVVDCHI